MAFLFKSKKAQERGLSSRDGPGPQQMGGGVGGLQGAPPSAAAVRMARDDKQARSTPTGSLNSLDDGSTPSPDQQFARRGTNGEPPVTPSDAAIRTGPQMAPNPASSSLYPWSQRRLTYTSSHPSPFPRYGAAVNSVSSKEGDIYVMGGLINSSTVKGDLWLIEAGGGMACYPLATTAEGPGPRVGHASLLVGNAFIVYGGDTKIDETDVLDETLYLLNTSTRQWSRALPAGPRPSGRYGHSLNILGSKIYIFGGQVEGYFMNDLCAFDLNQLQMANNRWEMLIRNSDSGGPPVGQIPPARTNHSVVTFNDKMYLFGGTNGYQWFNDVWCYDPIPNAWTQLDCIGYIPVPREGHAAALVDDVMYIFGGRTEEGSDLSDLAAFRISSRRWYTFQNMGASPSGRSGHSMTAVNKTIVVVGGEPSTPTSQVNDLAIVYVLDTTKIRYPNDAQIQSGNRAPQGTRRPSGSDSQAANTARGMSRDGSNGPDPKRIASTPREAPTNTSPTNGYGKGPNGLETNGPTAAVTTTSKLPRSAGGAAPPGPPPSMQAPKPTVNTASNVRPRGLSQDRDGAVGSPVAGGQNDSPVTKEATKEIESPITNGRRTPPTTTVRAPMVTPSSATSEPSKLPKATRQHRAQGSVDSTTEPGLKAVSIAPANRPSSPPPPTRQSSNPLSRRSSGRNSQTVALLKELDAARNRNAWYASELELARKAGYAPQNSLSPVLESRSTETFDDDDKPLIEALLAMRAELANVQLSVDKQTVLAAKQIAEAEKQRDAAIQEAVYAKAKLAAHMGSAASTPQMDNDPRFAESSGGERVVEVSRKLAAALGQQQDLQNRLEVMSSELSAEKRARQLADDTTAAAQRRMTELENYKQSNSTEVERLKAELHMVQREAREQSVAYSEAVAAVQLLKVERTDLEHKYNEVAGSSKEKGDTFASLREAVASSAELKATLEKRLTEEQTLREKLESQLTKLRGEHEARTNELIAASQRLRDAEELAESHAKEATSHRRAVLAGLDKISANSAAKPNQADVERMAALEGQVKAANLLAQKYKQEAQAASDKLRRAEERIAGLEAYQEQSSREGLSIRRQLQMALKDTQTLQAANSDLKHQLASQQLETNAITVQHNTLKDILGERGISPTSLARARGLSSPRTSSPEQTRMRDLEQQLSSSHAAHEDSKQKFAAQFEASETQYRNQISQLENDYHSAVQYVKGTEKMLKQIKQEAARYKTENARLKGEIEELEETAASRPPDGSAEWEKEKTALQKRLEKLESEIRASNAQLEKQIQAYRAQLDDAKRERDAALRNQEDASRLLSSNRKDLDQLQQENALLERRAVDAEQKVTLLLDQVESSVDNYRRRSRQVTSMGSELAAAAALQQQQHALANGGLGHARGESSEGESLYGGPDGRNSLALDNLANELETLRTQWEATNKNYRLSNAFDFENSVVDGGGARKDERSAATAPVGGGPGGSTGLGLSESLADWRKRLDADEAAAEGERAAAATTKSKARPPQ